MIIKNNLVTKISAMKLECKKEDLPTSLNLGFFSNGLFPNFLLAQKQFHLLEKKQPIFRFKIDIKEKKIIKPMLPPKKR